MAKTIDLTVLPAKVTVKNISKDSVSISKAITSDASIIKHDEGTTLPGAQDAQSAIAETTIAATSSEIQMFGVNLYKALDPEDELIIKVETSKELMYWTLLQEKLAGIFEITIEAAA